MTSSRLLRASAVFLGAAGLVQVAFDLIGHFGRIGPYADIFGGSDYTIGFAEAHALAVLLAVVFWRSAAQPTRGVHLVAGATHAILGAANLVFWPSFASFGLELPGAIATVLHIGLAVGHVAAVRVVQAEAPDGEPIGPTADLGFRLVATALFIAGIYLHTTHILIGRELFLAHVLRPEIEWPLTAAMVYALVTGLAVRSRIRLAGWWRAPYYVMLAYFALSVAIHLRAVVTGDSAYVSAFPEWYSYPVLVVMLSFLTFVRQLRFTAPESSGAAVSVPAR